jgi:hypothetical protein
VFALTAYVLGLATVSFYLRQLDVSLPDPAALKARFILTGAGMIGLAAISLAGPLVGDRWSRVRALDSLIAARQRTRTARAAPRPPRRLAYLIVGLAIPQVVMVILFGVTKTYAWDDPDLFANAFAAYCAAFMAGLAVLVTTLAVAGSIQRDVPRWSLVAALSALTLIALYLYLSFVAVNVYPHVPQQFGGGRPKHERLVFDHDAVTEARQLGMEVTPEKPLSQPVAVVFEGDGLRAVDVPGTGVVEISDSLIVGAVPAD